MDIWDHEAYAWQNLRGSKFIMVEIQWWVLMQSIILIFLYSISTVRCSFFFFVPFSQPFFYRQNRLESIRTVNIPIVTTCFMIPSFQILMEIKCPITITMLWPAVYISEYLIFFSHLVSFFITRYWL